MFINMTATGEEVVKNACEAKNVILYGAHNIARAVFAYLKRKRPDISVRFFAVTNMAGNPPEIEGIPVRPISNLVAWKDHCFVLIAMIDKFYGAVSETLSEYGFEEYGFLGMIEIMSLLNQEAIDFFQKETLGITAAFDQYDPTFLNIFKSNLEESDITPDLNSLCHYKLPVFSGFPFDEQALSYLNKFQFEQDCEKVCGKYRNLSNLNLIKNSSLEEIRQIMAVYMASSHKDGKLSEPFIIPAWTHAVQGGCSLTDMRINAFYDNEGENISAKNADFAEMTVMYWIWKNAPYTQYKGLCHYRRHFVFGAEQIAFLEDADIDVVLTTPRMVFPDIQSMFVGGTPINQQDFKLLMGILRQMYPAYFITAKVYWQEHFYYPNNMVIAKAEVFDQYCEWIFPILFELESFYRERGITRGDRYVAYSAEMLTSLFFVHNKNNLNIAVTDYRFLK